MGTAGLFMFAFCAFLSTSGVSIGLGLLLGAIFLNRSLWRRFMHDPVFVFFVASATYLVLHTVWAIWKFPDSTQLQTDRVWDWFRLWLFLCVAWWINGDLKRLKWVLFLPLVGLLIGMIYYVSTDTSVIWSGKRTGFHLRIIPFGLYSSTAILGLLLLAPRIWGNKENIPVFAVRVGFWLAVLAFLTQGLIMTQSRVSWLAALIVIPPCCVIRLRTLWRAHGISRCQGIAMAVFVVVFLSGVALANLKTIRNRLNEQLETIKTMAQLDYDFDVMPEVSAEYRIQVERFGVKKWLERPIFGWGPGTTKHLISHSGVPALLHPHWKGGRVWMDHVHNTYLEILVCFGLVGIILVLTVLMFLLKRLKNAYQEGRLPADYALFLTGTFALMAVWSFFDFRLLHWDWCSYWLLIAGATYAFYLPSADNATRKEILEPSGGADSDKSHPVSFKQTAGLDRL
jgi:O-antigen ligase